MLKNIAVFLLAPFPRTSQHYSRLSSFSSLCLETLHNILVFNENEKTPWWFRQLYINSEWFDLDWQIEMLWLNLSYPKQNDLFPFFKETMAKIKLYVNFIYLETLEVAGAGGRSRAGSVQQLQGSRLAWDEGQTVSSGWERDGGCGSWVRGAGVPSLVVRDGKEMPTHLCVGAQGLLGQFSKR